MIFVCCRVGETRVGHEGPEGGAGEAAVQRMRGLIVITFTFPVMTRDTHERTSWPVNNAGHGARVSEAVVAVTIPEKKAVGAKETARFHQIACVSFVNCGRPRGRVAQGLRTKQLASPVFHSKSKKAMRRRAEETGGGGWGLVGVGGQ
jgi:hypothetical protein